MGTNYYLEYPECANDDVNSKMETRHIGKSSGGWYFSLHVYPSEGIHTFDDWLDEISSVLFRGGEIKNEYGDRIEFHEITDVVLNRKSFKTTSTYPNMFYRSEREMLASNHAERGINGLLKHVADGRHCIGHGDGTVSHIVGDFS